VEEEEAQEAYFYFFSLYTFYGCM